LVKEVIEEIREKARSNRSRDLWEAIVDWIVENVIYAYPYEFDYPDMRLRASDFLALTKGLVVPGKYTGVCRHIVDLAIALARGLGIQAKYEMGMIYKDELGKVRFLGFHAWVVVLVDGYWHRVEVTIPGVPSLRVFTDLSLCPYPYLYVPLYTEYTNDQYTPGEYLRVFTIISEIESIEEPANQEGGEAPRETILLWICFTILAVLEIYLILRLRSLERRLKELK